MHFLFLKCGIAVPERDAQLALGRTGRFPYGLDIRALDRKRGRRQQHQYLLVRRQSHDNLRLLGVSVLGHDLLERLVRVYHVVLEGISPLRYVRYCEGEYLIAIPTLIGRYRISSVSLLARYNCIDLWIWWSFDLICRCDSWTATAICSGEANGSLHSLN